MKSDKTKERELIIKLSQEGRSSYEIANILGISQTKASFWIRRYKKTKSLENMPRSGRPTPLTKKQLNEIANLVKEKALEPRKSGITSKEVLQIIEHKTKKTYSLRHVQRTLHKMGFSLITPRISHIKKDKQAQEKFRNEFKKNLSRNIWVMK